MSARILFVVLVILVAGRSDAKPLPASKQSVAKSIIDELNLMPRSGHFGFKEAPAPVFADKLLEPYRADYTSLDELKKQIKDDPARYPLRAGVLRAMAVLQQSSRWKVVDFIARPITPAKAKAVFDEQKKQAADQFQMDNELEELRQLEDQRRNEPARRWQAHYDFVVAALEARLAFGFEYQYMLGLFRADHLPTLGPMETGWRLAPRARLQITEAKAKQLAVSALRRWQKIERDYPGTPWELFAQRERLSLRGLEWVPGKEPK